MSWLEMISTDVKWLMSHRSECWKRSWRTILLTKTTEMAAWKKKIGWWLRTVSIDLWRSNNFARVVLIGPRCFKHPQETCFPQEEDVRGFQAVIWHPFNSRLASA